MAGASDPLEDMLLLSEVDEKVGSLESQLGHQKTPSASYTGTGVKREGPAGAVSQFSGKVLDQAVGSLEQQQPQQGQRFNQEPSANEALSTLPTSFTSTLSPAGVINAGSNLQTLGASPTISPVPGSVLLPTQSAAASFNGATVLGSVDTSSVELMSSPAPQVMNHSNTLVHTKMLVPQQQPVSGNSVILGITPPPSAINSPISQLQSVVNGLGPPAVRLVSPLIAPVMATSVQQQRPGLVASPAGTGAPQLAVGPQQQTTIQLHPGFTLPPGMSLVRTKTGQLVMVPQHVLAQAQAKTQQDQTVTNIPPRPATPTATAAVRVSAPSPVPGTAQTVQLASPEHTRIKQSPSPSAPSTQSSSQQENTHNQCSNTPLTVKVEDSDKASIPLPSVNVAIGTPVQWRRPVQWKRPPPILTSTFRKPFKPSKRQQLKPEDDHGVLADSSIHGKSVSTESALLQDSPSINDVHKYIVDEDCLLQLFEDCPACGFMCEIQKTTRGTFLALHQLCLQCQFSRNWKSQQLEDVPSGDPHSCTSDPESSAAAITEIIGFSDENESLDEESSEVDEGEHNSDSDWDPLERHNIDRKLADSDSDTDADSESESDADEEHEKVCRKLCPECGKFFRIQNQAHICENKKPYSCLVCGKRFLEEVGLNLHSKIHKDGYKHVCKYCCSTFRTRPDKLLHEQSHPPAKKPYQCPDCPEVFANFQERREHLETHRGPKRHICHICNMEFVSNSALKRHVVVHTKEKKFVCGVCQRSFTQPNHLKSHMRVHTGEKPYQCQHCDKSFNHNVSLRSHIQRYHGQVPDPGMKVQIEKSSTNVSEVEKDETNQTNRSAANVEGAETDEMETSCVDSDEAEQSNTLCNLENDGDVEKKDVGKRKKRTGRPLGRPKKNAVITLDDANQSKRLLCVRNEEGQGNSDSTDEEQEHGSDPVSEPSKSKRRKKKKVNR